LIEIGGAYRLPEVMEASGAHLLEIGTTNRTRAGDYRVALQLHDCGAILKVHPSNYRVTGFTEEATIGDLASMSATAGIPLIHDIGSGLPDRNGSWLGPRPPAWLDGEPGARQSLEAGADLVTFSGDKLLGGPQAGILVGTSATIDLVRAHPLARALRVDGVTLAGLTGTLEAYAEDEVTAIPFWAQALASVDQVAARAGRISTRLGGRVVPGSSSVGAGSAPGTAIPSSLVMLDDEDHLFEPLLGQPTPVLTRRQDGALVLDPRSMDPTEDEELIEAVIRCRS
jgi:L-seryl-tRNA(Ser) seleniumtransferase